MENHVVLRSLLPTTPIVADGSLPRVQRPSNLGTVHWKFLRRHTFRVTEQPGNESFPRCELGDGFLCSRKWSGSSVSSSVIAFRLISEQQQGSSVSNRARH